MGIRFRNTAIKERINHHWKLKKRIFQYDERFHPQSMKNVNDFGFYIFWRPGYDNIDTVWSNVFDGTLLVDPGI
jgi:hypothetical protein